MRIRSVVLSTMLNNKKLLSGDPILYKAICKNILNPAYDFISRVAVESRITSVKLRRQDEESNNEKESG